MVRWEAKHGDTRKDRAYVEKQYAKLGKPLPEKYRSPEVDLRFVVFWECFIDCSTARAVGMTVGPIPYHVVMGWCDRRGLNPEMTHAVWDVVKQVDAAWLGAVNEASKPDQSRGKDGSPAKGGAASRKRGGA